MTSKCPTQRKVPSNGRAPLTWDMLKGIDGTTGDRGAGGRAAWIVLALTSVMSELFAEDDDGRIHAMYCLKG